MRFNRESDSIEIDESDLQSLKHDEPRTSTFRGISIECNDESANAKDSIRINREFDLNEIDESDSQFLKLDDPTISISWQTSIQDDDEKLRINR
jgi:hypothetical protein